MRVLVTGASGWIGSSLVTQLLTAGHSVLGLARSEASAAALDARGVEVVHGTLDDLDTLREAATAAGAVAHLGYKHDLAFNGDFQGAVTADRRAVEALGEALAGTDRPFAIASGTLGVAPGRVATEADGRALDGSNPFLGPGSRLETALHTLGLPSSEVRSSVVRLPPTVHGAGDHGFVATLVGVARQRGVSGYVGDGSQRWPATHRDDAATAFRLALEKAPAGTVVHAVAEAGVAIRAVAEVVGRHLRVPVVSVPHAEGGEHFGWLGAFLGVDGPASSTSTRELLGWEPTGPGLLEDLDEGHYFSVV